MFYSAATCKTERKPKAFRVNTVFRPISRRHKYTFKRDCISVILLPNSWAPVGPHSFFNEMLTKLKEYIHMLNLRWSDISKMPLAYTALRPGHASSVTPRDTSITLRYGHQDVMWMLVITSPGFLSASIPPVIAQVGGGNIQYPASKFSVMGFTITLC